MIRGFRAGLGAVEEQVAFAGVAGEAGGAFEFGASFGEAAEFLQEVAADAGQEVVIAQGWIGD